MAIRIAGIGKARALFQRLVDGLREAASGAVLERATAKVQEQIAAVSKARLSKHVFTGHALGTATATHTGGLIQLTSPRYLSFHAWWPFRTRMPPFVITRAIKIFKAELLAALDGRPSPLLVGDEEEEVAEAERSAKRETKRIAKEQRENASIAAANARVATRREKALARLEKLKTRAADRFRKQADRRHDRRVKALESKG